MFKKVIKVTEENKKKIADDYSMELENVEEFIGFYLVTDFASSHSGDFLDQKTLDELFIFETTLQNGYSEYSSR